MNFEQIRSFISITKTGSFSASAKDRFLSQPAISNQMKQLEEELGTPLFEKTRLKVSLTHEGETFLNYARQMLETEEKCHNALSGRKTNRLEIIDVGAPHLQTDNQMNEFCLRATQFLSKQGAVVRIVDYGEGADLPEKIRDGLIDFGVVNTQVKDDSLEYEPVFIEEICFVTPNERDYRLMNKKQLRDCMKNDDYIRFDFGLGSDYLWNEYFGKCLGVDLHDIKTKARASNYNIVLRMVEEGEGVGFASSVLLRKYLEEERILAFRCPYLLQKQFWVCYRKDRVESDAVLSGVKDILVEEMKESVPYLSMYKEGL